MIFHVSNLKTRVLDPPTHSYQFDTNCGKIRYVTKWPLEKTNRPSFFLIFKLSHALDGCSVYYLGCMVENINVLFAEWRIIEHDYFPILLLWIYSFSFWHGTHYLFSDIDAVTNTFHVLVNTYFLNFRLALMIVLRALVHLTYQLIFNSFLVFNFPFLNFE